MPSHRERRKGNAIPSRNKATLNNDTKDVRRERETNWWKSNAVGRQEQQVYQKDIQGSQPAYHSRDHPTNMHAVRNSRELLANAHDTRDRNARNEQNYANQSDGLKTSDYHAPQRVPVQDNRPRTNEQQVPNWYQEGKSHTGLESHSMTATIYNEAVRSHQAQDRDPRETQFKMNNPELMKRKFYQPSEKVDERPAEQRGEAKDALQTQVCSRCYLEYC